MNTQRLFGVIGILRIITLFLGFIVLILTGIFHYGDFKEQLFFSIVIILFFTSIFVLVILILDVLQPTMANSVDMSFHVIGGTILLLATGLMMYSVFSIGDLCNFWYKVGLACKFENIHQPFIPRIFLAILSFINGVVYLFTGILIKRTEYI